MADSSRKMRLNRKEHRLCTGNIVMTIEQIEGSRQDVWEVVQHRLSTRRHHQILSFATFDAVRGRLRICQIPLHR